MWHRYVKFRIISNDQLKVLLGEDTEVEVQGNDISTSTEQEENFTKLRFHYRTLAEVKDQRRRYRRAQASQAATEVRLPTKPKLPVGFVVTYNVDCEKMKIDADVMEFDSSGHQLP